MKTKIVRTLDDFDLLVAKASFLMNKIKELTQQRQDVIDEITNLLLDNNKTSLTTTCGQLVRISNVLNVSTQKLPGDQHYKLFEWCKRNDLVNINVQKLLAAMEKGMVPPIAIRANKPRAKFVSQSPVNVLINFEKETIKSWKNTTPDKRNPHMRELHDAGATFTEIGRIYKISPTQVSRILKKRDTVKGIRNKPSISVTIEE